MFKSSLRFSIAAAIAGAVARYAPAPAVPVIPPRLSRGKVGMVRARSSHKQNRRRLLKAAARRNSRG